MGERTYRDEQHDKMWVDFYIGSGPENPPMTTRVDRLERAAINSHTTKNLALATLLTLIGTIVAALILRSLGVRM